MNCAVLEQDGMLLIIDCGMTFPDEETLGVELVMPDLDWLVENETRIAGLVITHGHFDHIGAVPYLLEQIDLPIYAPPLAAEMIRATLQERDLDDGVVIHKFEAGSRFKVGPFEIEAIHVNHSIPQTCALAIRTSSSQSMSSGVAVTSSSASAVSASMGPSTSSTRATKSGWPG